MPDSPVSPRFDVTTLGEIMLRLSVPVGVRLEMASQFDVVPAGAESNMVSLLARLERRAAFVTGLPATAPGRLAAHQLRMAGVDLAGVVWSDDGRMGAYYVEYAAPPRPIQVTYDRADSCMARLTPEEVDWAHLLDTRLLHLTGITPALSPDAHRIVEEATRRARERGLARSFDVNYRGKLWTPEQAATALRPLMDGVDLLFCAHADATLLFGCAAEPETALHELAAQTGARHVVMSVGDAGLLGWDGATLHHQTAVPTQIVDRLGAGDALAAGVIHGWLAGDFRQGLRYGTILAALALSQHGDMVVTTPDELHALSTTLGGGRVAR